MKVLLTGANGLLGNHLARLLLREGHDVRALVRRDSKLDALDGLDVELAYGDVRDASALRAAAQGCELLYHTAAVFSYWGHSREAMMATAQEGARNAVEAARDAGIRRIVLTSSAAVLGGHLTPTPLGEADEVRIPGAPDYFDSKVLQEQAALDQGRALGVEVVAVNPAVFLGPRDMRPSAGLPSVTSYLADPLKLTWPGGVNLIHVEDVARAHLFLAEHGQPGQRHLVCAQNWEWSTFHQTLSELAGVGGPYLSMSPRAAKLGTALMELGAKITRKPPLGTQDQARVVGRYFWYKADKLLGLGFAPPRPSREALVDTLAWLLDSPLLDPKVKAKLKPSAEVVAARERMRV
jgi:dihydroflavonol-4-reductase